jgi:hypothetical protein
MCPEFHSLWLVPQWCAYLCWKLSLLLRSSQELQDEPQQLSKWISCDKFAITPTPYELLRMIVCPCVPSILLWVMLCLLVLWSCLSYSAAHCMTTQKSKSSGLAVNNAFLSRVHMYSCYVRGLRYSLKFAFPSQNNVMWGERESSYYYVVPTRDTQRSSPKTQRSAQPYAHWA